MSLCDRLIGGAVDGLMLAIDTIASFWQTPREVEWAKAAADGLAEREAEEEVAEPRVPLCANCDARLGEIAAQSQIVEGMFCSVRCVSVAEVRDAIKTMRAETSAPPPGAVDGPAEGEPPEPSAGVGPNSPKWLRDLIEATEDFCGVPRGTCYGPLESADLAEPSAPAAVDDPRPPCVYCLGLNKADLFVPLGDTYEGMCLDCAELNEVCVIPPAPSAEVEPPASAPSAESPAPEFDWVTTAIPVIAGVLTEHHPIGPRWNSNVPVPCADATGQVHAEFYDREDWRAHVAPIIAAALQTPRSTTVYDFPSGDRPRPLADFPKYQNPRK